MRTLMMIVRFDIHFDGEEVYHLGGKDDGEVAVT